MNRRPGVVGRNAEGEHVFLLAVADAGLRIDQEFVGGRPVGREHLGAPHHQAVLALVDHAEVDELLSCSCDPLERSLCGLTIAWVRNRSRSRQCVVVAHVVGELCAALAEEVGAVREGHQHGVEIVGRAPDHAEGRVGPDLHRLAPLDEIGMGLRHHERRASRLAAVFRRVGHHGAVLRQRLQVEQLRDGADRPPEHRIGRDVLHPPARDPNSRGLSRRPAMNSLPFRTIRHPRCRLSVAPRRPLSAARGEPRASVLNLLLHSAFSPDALTIGHHFSVSALWCARSASGVCWSRGQTSWPCSAGVAARRDRRAPP